MDNKDLEKMFEVIASLEPLNPRSVANKDLNEDSSSSNIKIKDENSTSTLKPRKPSMPLCMTATTARRGSMDPRLSMFQNERNHSNSNINQLNLFRMNSKSVSKITQEKSWSETHNEERFNDKHVLRYNDDQNVYDKVSIPILIEEINRNSVDNDQISDKRDTLTSLEIETVVPRQILYRNSLELLRLKELRHSNHSENACHNRSVENKTNLFSTLQSAPQSARTSVMNSLSCVTDNQSSIDSGVDQTMHINLQSFLSNEAANSSESFSDMSESNVTTFLEKESISLNDKSFVTHNWMNISAKSSEKSYLEEKNEEQYSKKIIPMIKSEEEQNMFFRMISNEISLNSFTTKEIIKFFMRNGTFSSQIIDKFQTAISVCNLLKMKFAVPEESFCQIIEVITKESLERPLEDHENILEIFNSWGIENCANKFIFQENPGMYKIFREPSIFVNEMKTNFEISDPMWIKGMNSKWMRTTCSITDYSIYYSLKPNSTDQKDLNLLVNLKNVDFYQCSNNKKIKKEFKSPTMELIILKENKLDHKPQANAYLAPSDFQQKERWLEALKVAKYSFSQLRNNYLEHQMVFPMGFRSQANSEATIQENFIYV